MVNSAFYPYTGRAFLRRGLKLHYLDEGHGDAVVMVHGNPSWSIYFRGLVEGLKDGHRLIVPDHIGCGLSDKPDDSRYDYTLASRVDDLEALLDSLGLTEKVTLVLHDWGGMIGMAYACRHPERVKKLVILNTGAFFLPSGKTFPWALRLCRTRLGALLVRGCNAFALAATYVCTKKVPMSRQLRAAYLAPYGSWADRIATLRFVQDIPLDAGDKSYDLVSRTQDSLMLLSHVPMLICWGMQDFVFDRHFLAEWVRRFPDAVVHRFPDAGHYVLEDEGPAILKLVREFLK